MAIKKLLVTFLLFALALASVVEGTCPDAKRILPCTCQGGNGKEVLRCLNIPLVSVLERVARNSNGYTYDQVYIEASILPYVPKIVLETMITKYLSLEDLTLNRLVDGIPNTPSELKSIVLRNIKILNGFSWEVFEKTTGLESLDVDQITIPVLTGDFNKYVSPNLTTLYLQNNGIKEITEGAFQGFERIQLLSLYNNKLLELRRESFPTPFNVELLFLQNNKLAALPDNIFAGMPNLRAVLLGGNQISRVNEAVFSNRIPDIVNLSNNPMKCDCYLKWIIDRNAKNIVGKCVAPKQLSGKSFQELTTSDFQC